jgi:hypothetical protein
LPFKGVKTFESFLQKSGFMDSHHADDDHALQPFQSTASG